MDLVCTSNRVLHSDGNVRSRNPTYVLFRKLWKRQTRGVPAVEGGSEYAFPDVSTDASNVRSKRTGSRVQRADDVRTGERDAGLGMEVKNMEVIKCDSCGRAVPTGSLVLCTMIATSHPYKEVLFHHCGNCIKTNCTILELLRRDIGNAVKDAVEHDREITIRLSKKEVR